MRLLVTESAQTESLKCVEFNPDEIPAYAILSHTWTKDEVLLADIINGTAGNRGAYQKVVSTCEQALSDGLAYVWIDTCCIDKTSSAELSEAINSMYAWYRDADVCYAHLSDLFAEPPHGVATLAGSRWFTRGWTLQELLAPSRVIFYAGDEWVRIGDKLDLSLELARITKISVDILRGKRPIETASIANRMGWAARRVTTRPEDIAYCLLGIFSINMPLLYGEGTKAFKRLQEEILKQTDDESLFVWQDEDAPDDKDYGFLASSPKCFENTQAVVPYVGNRKGMDGYNTNNPPGKTDRRLRMTPTTMTSQGLAIKLPCHRPTWPATQNLGLDYEGKDRYGRVVYHAILHCPPPDFRSGCYVSVWVAELYPDGLYFARIKASSLGLVGEDARSSAYNLNLFIRPNPESREARLDRVQPWHYVDIDNGPWGGYELTDMSKLTFRSVVGKREAVFSEIKAPVKEHFRKIVIERGQSNVTVALMFKRRDDGHRLLITIGCLDPVRLAFSAHELSKDGGSGMPSLQTLQTKFIPNPMGSTVNLSNHEVTITSRDHKDPDFTDNTRDDLTINITPVGHQIGPVPSSVSGGSEGNSRDGSQTSRFRKMLSLDRRK